jgi:nucleoid-associated protein YgaU
MPDSLLDIRDDVEALTEGFTAAVAAIESALTTGTATAAQLSALRADLTGYRGDLAAIRTDLDATDVSDFLVFDDGEILVRLWLWERDTRHALVGLAPKVRAAETVATRLVAGAAREVYVTRKGDTLQRIAARFLGDWRAWPRIADANGLDGGTLTSGTRITIPPKR